MAHMIEKNNVFVVGEPAWHGLGVVLKDPPSVEDAIRLARLDWSVRLEPLCLANAHEKGVSHRATVRESDGRVLGVVGPGYVPLQNQAAFAWFQPFVEQKLVAL